MPDFFVCEVGPMGGISIIFVANDRASCDLFITRNPDRELEIFANVTVFEN